MGHQALLVNTIYVASPPCSPQESQDSSRCGTSVDDTASCCSVKIPNHRGLLKAIALPHTERQCGFFLVYLCVLCVCLSVYLSVCTYRQQMHYSQLNFTFSLLVQHRPNPCSPIPPHPAHDPKQPTVINHYQSTHVSPPAFPLCLPPAYAPSHQPAYQ